MAHQLEKEIEKACCKKVKELGGLAIKLGSYNGIPDRMFLLPGAKIFFVEFKRPGGRVRKLQYWWRNQLLRLGFSSYIIDNVEDFELMLDGVMSGQG